MRVLSSLFGDVVLVNRFQYNMFRASSRARSTLLRLETILCEGTVDAADILLKLLTSFMRLNLLKLSILWKLRKKFEIVDTVGLVENLFRVRLT